MRVAVFSAKSYDIEYLGAAAAGRHELEFLEPRLSAQTAGLATSPIGWCAMMSSLDCSRFQMCS